MPKVEKEITIMNRQGLHARPAAMFVQIAQKYESELTVENSEEKVNGKSIMGILMLGVQHKNTIKITANGDDAEELVKELEEYLNRDE